MAKQVINIGTVANDGTGDPLRTAFDKVNDNFTELYNDDAGDVDSVNGQTGTVVLDTDDISEGTNKYNVTHTGEVTGATALTIANDVITYAKLGGEFTTTDAKGNVSGTATLDFGADQVFTATMTANTAFSFSGADIGMTKDLILTGDFEPSFPVGTKQVAGTYDGTVSNLIQIVAVANGDYWLSVSQEQV
jgi:hypothetical protein